MPFSPELDHFFFLSAQLMFPSNLWGEKSIIKKRQKEEKPNSQHMVYVNIVVVSVWGAKLRSEWKRGLAEDLKWLFLQAQSIQIHMEWVKDHANDEALQTYWKTKVDQLEKNQKNRNLSVRSTTLVSIMWETTAHFKIFTRFIKP